MSIYGMLVAGAPPSLASSRAVALPPSLWVGGKAREATPLGGRGMPVVVECSSRPKKKATAHHMKTRPKKTQPWDIRRGPTAYPPLPPLPPDWTLASSQESPQEQQLPLQGVAAAPPAS